MRRGTQNRCGENPGEFVQAQNPPWRLLWGYLFYRAAFSPLRVGSTLGVGRTGGGGVFLGILCTAGCSAADSGAKVATSGFQLTLCRTFSGCRSNSQVARIILFHTGISIVAADGIFTFDIQGCVKKSFHRSTIFFGSFIISPCLAGRMNL